MESKGNDALLSRTKVTEFNVNYGGLIPVTFGVLLLVGCAAAYVIAVNRGNVEAVLPLISDAAGSPPQNGIFGTIICIGGMFGAVFMMQRYMIISEKNGEMSRLVDVLNKLCFFAGIVSMLGITLITGYPINFYRNRDVWLKDVGIPHMIGGLLLFGLGLVYLALQCGITLLLKTKNECTLTLRVLLFLACTVAFVYHMMHVPDNFGGFSHLYYVNSSVVDNSTSLLPYPSTLGVDLKLPIDMSEAYFTSAVAEWAFVICFCFYFFTFYQEAQEYCVQIVIETHTPSDHSAEDHRPDIRKASVRYSTDIRPDVKPPPPEMRKFHRRDSTCQTTDDSTAKILYPSKYSKSKDKSKQNGVNKKSLNDSELDAKLNKLLQEADKKQKKVVENGTQHSISTGTEDMTEEASGKQDMSETERKVVEKIDIVIQNAEEDDVKKSTEGAQSGVAVDDEEKPSSCPLAVQ